MQYFTARTPLQTATRCTCVATGRTWCVAAAWKDTQTTLLLQQWAAPGVLQRRGGTHRHTDHVRYACICVAISRTWCVAASRKDTQTQRPRYCCSNGRHLACGSVVEGQYSVTAVRVERTQHTDARVAVVTVEPDRLLAV